MQQMNQAAIMDVVSGESDGIKFAYQLYKFLQERITGDIQDLIRRENWGSVQQYKKTTEKAQETQGHLLVFLGKQNESELRSRNLESEVSNFFIGYVAKSNQAQQEMKYRQDQETQMRQDQFRHMRA